MIVIFLFSSQSGRVSAQVSGNITDKIISVINPDYRSLSTYEQRIYYKDIHFLIRKFAHFTIFMMLGILSVLTFDSYNLRKAYLKIVMSAGLCLFYAAMDETHQLFSDGRSAQLSDVMIDFSGSLIGILIISLILHSLRKLNKKRKA